MKANYGQGVADLEGFANANGQSFTEDLILKTLFGGLTGIQAVEETLANYGTESNAPAWLQPMWNTLVAQFGISSTGSGTLQIGINGGIDVNNQRIIGVPGTSGNYYQYTDLSSSLYNFAEAYAEANPGIVEAIALETASQVPQDAANYAAQQLQLAEAYGPSNPAPDRNDTDRFGQIMADLGGSDEANGSNFTENTSLSALFGGENSISFIEQYLSQFATEADAPTWLQPMYTTLMNQFGSSPTGGGYIISKNDIDSMRISAPGTDGNFYEYTTLAESMYGFAQAYAGAVALGIA